MATTTTTKTDNALVLRAPDYHASYTVRSGRYYLTGADGTVTADSQEEADELRRAGYTDPSAGTAKAAKEAATIIADTATATASVVTPPPPSAASARPGTAIATPSIG